ncbi:MAG: hypothetical protein SFU85_05725 [Candidatus Methylacidiphilales bacterium]|nr:hypothetical protein [Candidatus Methylacidiphilales bacterium]
MNAKICLITPGHLASTPRLVREAQALHEAGYDIHVLSGRHYPPVEPLDRSILDSVSWKVTRVPMPHNLQAKARRALARFWLKTSTPIPASWAATAHHAHASTLTAAASHIPAQLYIGHCPAGLAAAAGAACRNHARLGFDLEDFHPTETSFARNDTAEHRALRILLAKWLPLCHHLTAASPGIARAAGEFTTRPIRPVLNVFSKRDAPHTPGQASFCPGETLRFYWFSQTIGPGRGLENAVRVLGRLRHPAELHLRGFPDPGFIAHLQQLAAREPRPCRILVLPPAPPDEMVRLAADAHMGLSLEESQPPNRDLCLTNKIFAYLLAGIPQWLSPTSAQSAFFPEIRSAALLADPAQPDATAAAVDAHFNNPAGVDHARREARRLAETRYCWEVEQTGFLASVREALAG